jgi:hypothetical protein
MTILTKWCGYVRKLEGSSGRNEEHEGEDSTTTSAELVVPETGKPTITFICDNILISRSQPSLFSYTNIHYKRG